MNTSRREFVKMLGAAAAASLIPGQLFARNFKALTRNLPGHELFPHINAPQIAAVSDAIVVMSNGLCLKNGKRLPCPALFGARLAGELIVGRRGPELVQARIGGRTKILAQKIATYPGVGIAVAATPRGLLAAAAGERSGTLKVYGSATGDQLIVADRWVHPLLAFDAKRERLHLVFAPWNESSSIYDVIYYLRSDDYGRSWTRTDGKILELPIHPYPTEYGGGKLEPDVLSVRGQANGPDANTLPHCLALDRNGNPHLLYSFCRPYWIAAGAQNAGPVEPRMRTRHIRWDGDRWRAAEIDRGWSLDVAGGSLAFDEAGALHALLTCKQKHNQWLDLGHSSSTDGGQTWSAIIPMSKYNPGRASHYLAPQLVIAKETAHFVFVERSARSAVAWQGSASIPAILRSRPKAG